MYNKIIYIILVLIVTSVVSVNTGCNDGIDQSAIDSINKYTNLINQYPQDPFYYVTRGDIYFVNQQYLQAVQDYDAALNIDPFNLEALRKLAVTYEKIDKYAESLKEYNNLIALYPGADDYINRGLLHEKYKNLPMAIADYDRAISLSPDNINYYMIRGNALDKAGNYQRSTQDYTEVIKRQPNNIGAILNRGNAFYNGGNFKGAVVDFEKVILLDPSYEGDLKEKLQVSRINAQKQ
ncbi:MAG TPA: tetratricopeptide repeat protein [Ignavibacteria bacterium]|nr:tetratricopeptide repeat protein [Ignavibacteria bacterium]